MANIDDLKQNKEVIIDATDPNASTTNNRVSMGGSSVAAPKGKTIVVAKNKSSREALDLSTLPKDTTGDENIHESLAKDILEGENSIFAQYVDRKTKEAEEWIEEKEEELDLNAELSEEDKDDSETNSILDSLNSHEDEELNDDEDNTSIIEDDLSSYAVMEDEKFDDDTAEDDEDNTKIEEEEATMDKDTIHPLEEVVVEEEKKEEVKEERIDTSDIELDENESTTTEIIRMIDEDDEEDEEKEDSNDEDEVLKHLQKLATEKLKPASKKLDISSYTIMKKPITNTKFLQQQNVKVAKWVLPSQESIVQMKEFLGSEIEQLREYSEDATSVTSLTRKFRTIYDHIVSPKPTTYEAWLKSTPYDDIDHYFFAIYIACFKSANYIPVDCTNPACKETFLTDDVPIMNMVKFESNEAKEKFQKIYQNETAFANKKGIYATEIIPLSNQIAVGFKEPSIYSLMEIASLDARFREKYSSILDYIPYIDALYIIDEANKQITPIGYKGFAENATKTIKSKIQKFDSVLKSLSIDEFGPIKAYIRAIRERKSGFSYVFPSVTCPKCGKATEESPISAEEMVFTRYQLGNLVTTSLK